MNNVIDAYALSPPSAEITEPSGKGYVLIPLGKGEVPELTDYPYEVLMVRRITSRRIEIATWRWRARSRAAALCSVANQKRQKRRYAATGSLPREK